MPENRHKNIKMAGLVNDKENAVEVIYLKISMVLCTVSIMSL